MEGRKTIFNYLEEVLCIFAISILILIGIAYITGDTVKDFASMFQLGSKGLALTTMLQFFLMAVFITVLKYLLFSEFLLKNNLILLKTMIMIVIIVIMTAVFANIFDWFPTNEWQPWAGFAISFGICFSSGTVLMVIKNNMENRKIKEGLAKLKQEISEEEHNE